MKKIIATLLWAMMAPLSAQSIFISEFHYDNFQADTNEFVEITSWAQTDLGCYQLLYINGGVTPPVAYKTIKLKDSLVALQLNGYGTLVITNTKKDQIQNGPKDGFLLYDSCHKTAVQYISYEGTIPAIAPFTEMASVDIGVLQTAEADSVSIQASKAAESQTFVWSKAGHTPGAVNPDIEWNTTSHGTLKGKIYLSTENCQSSASTQASATIIDLFGRPIFSVLAKPDGSFAFFGVPVGMYFLWINVPEGFIGQEKSNVAKVIVSGEETSYSFCLEQIITVVQEPMLTDEITVDLDGSNVDIKSAATIQRIELYNLSGQKEVFYGPRFKSHLQGTLIMCVVTHEGIHRRKIILE